jgi:hypothetical protein
VFKFLHLFKKLLIVILIAKITVSCVPKSKEETVEVNTAGIFEPVSFEVVGGNDLGEVLTGSEPVSAVLRVTNNSAYPLTGLDLEFDIGESTANMAYAIFESGKAEFPGSGGSCDGVSRTLAPLKSCTMVISFNPLRSGKFKQLVTFTYKNFVKEEKIKETLTVLSGEEASLIFIGTSQLFNYGIIEQTEPVLKYQTLVVENRGGLSARNLDVNLLSSDDPSAFILESHNCPLVLKAFKNCTAKVSYIPLNILESDPAADFSSQLQFNYVKDGKVSTKNLNANFAFSSTKIQANFDTNLGVVEFEPDVIVGNRVDKFIRIINKGFREGIPKKIIVKDSADDIQAVCSKAAVGNILDCRQNDGVTPSTLEISPFIFDDIDSCMDREVLGVVNETAGESCDFNVAFQPSVAYLTDRDFAGWTFSLEYDARWKGLVTILTEKLFDVLANSLAAARLQWEFFGLNSTPFTDQDPDLAESFYDIGRIALISDAAYYTPFELRVKNIGSVPASITARYDGQATPQNITTVQTDIMSVSDSPFPTFWESVSSNCTTIDPGQVCSITGQLTPLSYAPMPGSEDIQHRLFLDVNPLGAPGPDRYKQFFLTYDDGTTYEDDNSLRTDRLMEARVTGILVTKGYLVWDGDPAAIGNVGSVSEKGTRTKQFVLKNVGTGTVPYIKLHDSSHLNFPPSVNDSYTQVFTALAAAPPGGVTKDCYTVVDYEIENYANYLIDPDVYPLVSPDGLGPGEKCSFTVEAKLKTHESADSSDYPDIGSEKRRFFHSAKNNTIEIWDLFSGTRAGNFTISYFDGDIGLGLPAPYQDNFGYYQSLANVDVRVSFSDLRSFFVDTPFPIESAILYRPAVIYPAIAGAAAWDTDHFTGYTAPEFWLQNALSGATPGSHQALSSAHVTSLVDSSYDFVFHMGSFPANNQTFGGSFLLFAHGGLGATISDRTFVGDAEITLVSTHPATPYSFMVDETFVINFATNTPGVYERILTISYNNGYEDVTRTVRVIAEAVSGYADLELDTQEYNVVLVGASAFETLDGLIESNVPLGFMAPLTTSSFFAVKGSAVYAKKQFTLTNTTGTNITDLNVMLKAGASSGSFNNTTSNYWVENESNCNSLAAAASCSFEVVFKPGVSAPPTDSVIMVLTYMIQPNQAISKMVTLQFDAGSPAQLSVLTMNTISVFDSSDSVIKPSYEINFGSSVDPIHIKVNAYPESTLHPTTYTVQNTSSLKASFLKMLGSPPYNTVLTAPVEIFNDGSKIITASVPCFIGDDDPLTVPYVDTQGFNASTLGLCQLNFTYIADETYVGSTIVKEDNVMTIDFYDNKWSSFNSLYFHVVGFIEPNFSTTALGYQNVSAKSDGSVSWSWGAFTPNNPAWGAVTGYRVFTSTIGASLTDVYGTGATYTDVNNTTFTINYLALIPGRYYYYKVVPKRTIGAKTYLSIDPLLPTLKVVVPPIGSTYNHLLGAIVDKGYISTPGTRSENSAICTSERYTLFDGGSTVNKFKQLINTNVWNYINSDPDTVNYSTYSNYQAPAYPHWLADAPVDIEPIFTPHGGFCSCNTLQVVSPANMFYQKTCADSSCNNLYQVVGGDGVDYFYDGTAYVESNMIAFPRCWAPI